VTSVISQWTGGFSYLSGYFTPEPAGQSVDVPVSNTGDSDNWLFAVCAWQTPATFGSTVAVGDDAHNWWEPLGAPTGTSPDDGITRCSVWAAPNPSVAGNVFVSPNGYCQALIAFVFEVQGMSPWLDVPGVVTAYANDATALSGLALAAPGSQALVLSVCATDKTTATVTGPGAGWTALPAQSWSNGVDHTSDITIATSYQVTSAATAAAYTTSGTADLAGLMAAVLISPAAPFAPSQTWPHIQFQLGFGAGVQTPWDQVTWTDVTGRFRGMTTQRGKQYELDSVQAGTVNMTLSNNDAALTPENSASPYCPDVTVYTPVRVLATWPPPPAAGAKTYVVFRGFMERWPLALTSSRYQNTAGVATDVWALMTPLLNTITRAEILLDQPFAYWTMSDAAGAPYAANLAPGNMNPLQVIQSKYGIGSSTVSFGNDPSDLIIGDPSGTVWAQSGLTSGQGSDGYALVYSDSGLPSLAGGVTAEGWFQVSNSNPAVVGWTLIILKNTATPMFKVWVRASDGAMMVTAWDKTTHVSTNTVVNSAQSWADSTFTHVALLLTQTTWQVILDGGAFPGASGSCNLGSTWAFTDFGGEADRLFSGNMFNGQVAHLAIFPRLLPNARIVSHFYGTTAGFGSGQELAGARIERILADSGCLQPRSIGVTVDAVQGALDIQGQATGQNVTNIAESESGLLYADAAGYLCYTPRRAGYNLGSLWTAGEMAGQPFNLNPTFAGLLAPWTAYQGTITLTQAQVYGAPYSALLTPSPSVTFCEILDAPVLVTAGEEYTASAWVYSPAGWGSVQIGFDWQAAGGGYLSTSTELFPVQAGQWTYLTTTQTAPAGAVSGEIRVGEAGSPAPANILYVSQAAMTAAFQTEAPYQADIQFDYDPSQVYNDITLTQFGAPQEIGGADISTVTAITSPASISAYGDQTLQETIYLFSAATQGDLANWILGTSDQPYIRVSQMTFDPSANPALWPIVLSAEVGQVITVNRRLGGTLTEISGQFQILNVAHSTAPGRWTTRIMAVAYLSNVLTCDDPDRGQLSGSNVLGF